MSNSGEILQDIEKTTKIKIIEYQISPIRDSHINYKKKRFSIFYQIEYALIDKYVQSRDARI